MDACSRQSHRHAQAHTHELVVRDTRSLKASQRESFVCIVYTGPRGDVTVGKLGGAVLFFFPPGGLKSCAWDGIEGIDWPRKKLDTGWGWRAQCGSDGSGLVKIDWVIL